MPPSHITVRAFCGIQRFLGVIGLGTLVPTATLFSLLVRYPDNSSAPLCGFGLAPLSIPRSRPRTFQYFLALLFYVLRFEWLPTPDSALPTGVVRHGGTMASADSRQTVCSAALSRFSRASQDKTCSFLTVQAGFTMRSLDRVLGKHALFTKICVDSKKASVSPLQLLPDAKKIVF